ncbi:hypothetical protein [Nocardia farcinica]|uniref:hypothetical protein n=1 Tax=Nocardia farcinica TaxID=37329 RepID=UPI000A3673E1|nr:hypothetical protein [Nocardia farcinica]
MQENDRPPAPSGDPEPSGDDRRSPHDSWTQRLHQAALFARSLYVRIEYADQLRDLIEQFLLNLL